MIILYVYIHTSYCKLNMKRICKPNTPPKKRQPQRDSCLHLLPSFLHQSSKKKTSFRVAFQPVATSIIQDALCEEHRNEQHRKLKGMEI